MPKLTHLNPYQWKPGQSGCPSGGRGKLIDEFYNLARARSPEALDKCIELMHCGDTRVELQAAMHIMDRGMGKCKELPPDSPDRPTFTPEEKIEMIREIARRHGYKMIIDADGSNNSEFGVQVRHGGLAPDEGFPSAILNDAISEPTDAAVEGGSQYHTTDVSIVNVEPVVALETKPKRCPTCRNTMKNCRCVSQEQWEKQLAASRPPRITFRTA